MRLLRRTLSILCLCALALAVTTALVYLYEDLRGGKVLLATERALTAQGEHLDRAYFVPPPVPDDQNLALAPFFVRELGYVRDSRTGQLVIFREVYPPCEKDDLKNMPYGDALSSKPRLPGWSNGTVVPDLVATQQGYRKSRHFPRNAQPGSSAEDILLALTRYGPALDEVAQAAATRPLARFPVDWNISNPSDLPTYHLWLIEKLVLTLRLRASVRLTAGHPSVEAAQDVLLALKLCQALENQPTLDGHHVHADCLSITLNAIWQGLAGRRWSADELLRFQTELGRVDLLGDCVHALRGERANSLATLDRLYDSGKLFDFLREASLADDMEETAMLIQNAPHGWLEQSQARLLKQEQGLIADGVAPEQRRVFPTKLEAVFATATKSRWPYNVLSRDALPIFGITIYHAARDQTGIDQAMVACALERFYLDRQRYPAVLAELTPTYLGHIPNDLFADVPLRYVLTPNGRYHLYSVGWNGRDDGGVVALSPDKSRRDDDAGDWVWQYEPLPSAPTTRHGK